MEETIERGTAAEPMQKRRETMEDGRRYIIFYTFGTDERRTTPGAKQDQEIENV